MRWLAIAGIWPVVLVAAGVRIPAGTVLPVRLETAVSTRTAKPGDEVRVVVIAARGGVPAGARVFGSVESSVPAAADRRASLVVRFSSMEVAGSKSALAARVQEVDNARESVDDAGRITGILAAETLAGRLDSGLDALAAQYAGLAGVLGAVKSALLPEPDTDIAYAAGVEMRLALTAPLVLAQSTPPAVPPCTHRKEMARVVSTAPVRTTAADRHTPGDLVNVFLAGSEAALRRAFTDAGWSEAEPMSAASRFETFLAVAEERGFAEAPVSTLLLGGKPPRLVFEKANDTFAQRHHVRVWLLASRIAGKPVWAAAATHDIAIDISTRDRTFVHAIEPRIDIEREKVVDDLGFAGHLAEAGWFDRAGVPRETRNATGDAVVTDGRAAFVILR